MSSEQEHQELDSQELSEAQISEERRLAELYQAAKDENELLEFKNYELLFKIQELEQQNQRQLYCNQQEGESFARGKEEPPTTNAPVANLDDVRDSMVPIGCWRSTGNEILATGDKNGGQVEADRRCSAAVDDDDGKLAGQSRTLARFAADAELHSKLASNADLRRQESSLLLLFNSLSRKPPPSSRSLPLELLTSSNSQHQQPLQADTLADHLGRHENTMMDHASSSDTLNPTARTNRSSCGISELHETNLTDAHTSSGAVMGSSPGGLIAQQEPGESEHNCSPACQLSCSQQSIGHNATQAELPDPIVGGDQSVKVMTRDELAKVDQHGRSLFIVAEQQPEVVDQSKLSNSEMQESKGSEQQVASKRGAARIAVPVLARQQSNTSIRNNTKRNCQQVGAAANYLRTRSKSSLGTQPNETISSSLASKRCQSQATLHQSSSLPRQIKRPQASGFQNRLASASQSNKTNRARQETLKPLANKLAPAGSETSSAVPSTDCHGFPSSANRPASSARLGAWQPRTGNSGGFVTQIPTLISQSHAPASSTRTTANGNNSTCAPNRPRSSSSSSLIVSSEAGKSPTIANRRPTGGQRRAAVATEGALQPTALKRGSKSMSNLVSGELASNCECIDDHASSSPESSAALNDKSAPLEADVEPARVHETCDSTLASSSTKATCVDHTSGKPNEMQLINGQSIDDRHQSGRHSPEASEHASLIENSANLIGEQTWEGPVQTDPIGLASQQVCEQCKLLQAKLARLLEDREQLCEQINELEEMENDSRLMSQKLAKQLLNIEQQSDLCKCELKRAHENGSRLQFQNRRLNFELRLRLDVNQRLQNQLSRLQGELAKANNGADHSATTSHETAAAADDHQSLTKVAAQIGERASSRSAEPQLEAEQASSIEPDILRQDKRVEGSAQLVGNAAETPKEVADDSAYSKSSASSDDTSNASEDGDRSDAEHATTFGTQVIAGAQAEESAQVASTGPENQQLQVNSSSSSGDESDHHESPAGLTGSDQALVSQQASSSGLTSRQQVLRKKISTARILRGIQVQQSSATISSKSPGSQNQQTSWHANISQARLAKVTTDSENQPVECPGEHSVGTVEKVLEGVDNIEQGRADDILRSLIDRPPAREPDRNPTEDKQSTEAQQQVEQLRLEVAALKTRLHQARTLNDNLVSELRSNKDRLDQLRAPQQYQSTEVKQQGLTRQRSVVQINNRSQNSSLQVATATLVECKHQEGQCCCDRHRQQTIICPQIAEDQQTRRDHPDCVSLDELVEFLKFLLDKVHSHHGRTFELVNECQRLATSALLASYSHQMNLIHHSSAVMAGNQLLGQQATNSNDQPPLKPPPRRQRQQSTNQRVTGACKSQQQVSIDQQTKQSSGGRAYVALQVAKQTLFSIVPIYYNSSSNSSSNSNSKQTITERDDGQTAKVKRSIGGSLVTGRLSKSKSWVVLNKSSTSNESSSMGHNNHDFGGEDNRKNVSVLKIGSTKSVDNLLDADPDRFQVRETVPQVATDQESQLRKVKSSLNEDIERYRVHFNGQLLDLLTRQNWCENVIAEKLRHYQSSRQTISQSSMMCQQRVSNPNTRQREVEFAGAKLITNTITKSTKVPINAVSLDPNGHQQHRSAWSANKQSHYGGSLC